MVELRIFYDGGCPLCLAEMKHLLSLDVEQSIDLVDINQQGFEEKYPAINKDKADDSIILGLDVTHKAWTLVGKGRWTAILRWPVIRVVTDWAYLLFAKYRHPLSRLITGKSRCESCSLERKKC